MDNTVLKIVEHFNSRAERIGVSFVPEVWQEGYAVVQMKAGEAHTAEYIDGSAVVSLPFEIRYRRVARSSEDVREILAVFSAIRSICRRESVDMGDFLPADISVEGAAVADKTYSDGSVEYAGKYRLIYLKEDT